MASLIPIRRSFAFASSSTHSPFSFPSFSRSFHSVYLVTRHRNSFFAPTGSLSEASSIGSSSLRLQNQCRMSSSTSQGATTSASSSSSASTAGNSGSRPTSASTAATTISNAKSSISQKQETPPDLVFVRDLFVKALTGVDAWHRPEPQPVTISIWLRTSVAQAGSTDHLTYSLNYAVITRKVTKMVETGRFKSLEDIAERVAKTVLGDSVGGQWAKIQVTKPRALLRADASEIVITRQRVDKETTNNSIADRKQRSTSSATKKNDVDSDDTHNYDAEYDSSPSIRSLSLADSFDAVQVPGSVDTVRIHNLRLVTIIGVNTIERMHKQNVVLDLTLYKTNKTFGIAPGLFDKAYDFRKVVQVVTDHVEDSSYKTVEAFVTSVAQVICEAGVAKVTVRAEKPSALTFADAAGVEVTRTKEYFDNEKKSHELLQGGYSGTASHSSSNLLEKPLFPDSGPLASNAQHHDDGKEHTVFIAFGSNIGNSLSAIQGAITELQNNNITILETSSIYESDPMYVTDQPNFYNGVFKASTTLSPLKLLDVLKEIEYGDFGKRVKIQQNGPRTIDLDILLYDNWAVNQPPKLTIPHVSMLERNFVLRPLKDIVSPDEIHPLTAEPFHSHLEQLFAIKTDASVQKSNVLRVVVPLRHLETLYQQKDKKDRFIVFDPDTHTCPTHVMAILNVTPDSFSDGGRFTSKSDTASTNIDLDSVVEAASKAVAAGATILDIGGMSTRPGVDGEKEVSVEEEIKRVVPAIKAIRKNLVGNELVVISIDTYRAAVAKAAIEAGADIVNDIGAGALDKDMFEVVRKLGVPIILNHTRGTPETMTKLARYEWVNEEQGGDEVEVDTDEAVINVVGQELEERVVAALESGLKRWQIILDPGIGFAKTAKHNVAIIRNFEKLRTLRENLSGFPWLVGPSRKKFIETLTTKAINKIDTKTTIKKSSAKDRVWGTAATVTALIGSGADIVRVHDIQEMMDVVRVSDAIYRDIGVEK